MRGKLVGLVAGAALLASVGIANANAKGPVQLTDGQLDNITAGAGPSSPLAGISPASGGIVPSTPLAAGSLLLGELVTFYTSFYTPFSTYNGSLTFTPITP